MLDASGTDKSVFATGGLGNDTLTTGAANDKLEGGPGNDILNGGDGNDIVYYSSTTQGIVVNLAALSNQATGVEVGTDQLIGIENVVGGSGNDRITGDALANRIDGGHGADRLNGGTGDDWYFVDDIADLVSKGAGQGLDRVISGVSYGLAVGAEIRSS